MNGRSTDPHAPLRDDVRRLGELLGQVLSEQGGPELLDAVERIRALAKSDRATDPGAVSQLADALSEVPVEQAVPLARAFSMFLSLSNVAEQYHRLRRRREYRANPDAPAQRGSFEDCFERVIAAGARWECARRERNSRHRHRERGNWLWPGATYRAASFEAGSPSLRERAAAE